MRITRNYSTATAAEAAADANLTEDMASVTITGVTGFLESIVHKRDSGAEVDDAATVSVVTGNTDIILLQAVADISTPINLRLLEQGVDGADLTTRTPFYLVGDTLIALIDDSASGPGGGKSGTIVLRISDSPRSRG